MALFSRHPLSADLRRSLREQLPEAGRVLAVGTGEGVVVAACVDCLAIHRDGHWEGIGWHLVAQGSWAEPRLQWNFADGQQGQVEMTAPGDVPGVFHERVRASIVVEQSFEAPGGGHVVIAGRRRLGVEVPMVWQATTLGRARLDDPEVAAFVLARTADLRGEFDLC